MLTEKYVMSGSLCWLTSYFYSNDQLFKKVQNTITYHSNHMKSLYAGVVQQNLSSDKDNTT